MKSIEIHTCDWNFAHTSDRVELKIENSKRECNTHQLSNGENFDHGDVDIFNDKATLNDCFHWPILDSNITVTVSKWGTDGWAFCWAKIITNNSKIYYCENTNNYDLDDGNPKSIAMACVPEGMYTRVSNALYLYFNLYFI